MKFEEEIRKHQQEQIDHIEKSIDFSLDNAFQDEIEKSINHKYFKREGNPGNYKYYYTEAEYKEAKKTPTTKENKKEKTDKEIIERLQEATEHHITFFDKGANEVSIKDATTLYVGSSLDGEGFLGKTITLPKNKELITPEFVMGKLNNDKVYASFAEKFKNILIKNDMYNEYDTSIYPTSYGLGVASFSSKKGNERVSKILDDLGLKYEGSWSDAQYVWRYKIAKNKSNLEIMENLK